MMTNIKTEPYHRSTIASTRAHTGTCESKGAHLCQAGDEAWSHGLVFTSRMSLPTPVRACLCVRACMCVPLRVCVRACVRLRACSHMRTKIRAV